MDRKIIFATVILVTIILITNCETKEHIMTKGSLLDRSNLFAWCIIPYDSMNRTSEERITMLQELGINGYAYDWRPEHLEDMSHELSIMKEKNMDLTGVWFWVNGSGDFYFDQYNEHILQVLKKENIKTDIWLGIPEEYFDSFSEGDKLLKAKELIDYTYKRAKEIGCTISLYNHGGWYGEPENQLAIIEGLGYEDIGMVYNFHHGHDHIDSISTYFSRMKKYLRAVNINGMRKGGPKILSVGEGDEEIQMINSLIESGYDGPIGILGHVEDADVELILKGNLNGIEKIKSEL